VLLWFAWQLSASSVRLVSSAKTGGVLNDISGISPEVAYQVIARGSLVCIGLAAILGGRALLYVARRTSTVGRCAKWILTHPCVVILMLVALVGVQLGFARSVVIGDRLHVGIDDDAMISLRYANNFVHGLGLVYNPHEHVEGYTNFLWVLLMSVPLWLGVHPIVVPTVVIVTNFVCVGATSVLMSFTLRKLACPRWAAFAAVLCFVVDGNTVYYAASGLETSLLTLVAVASFSCIVHEKATLTFVLLGALPLVRSDGALMTCVLGAAACWHFWKCNLRIRGVALTLALPTAHVIFRRAYYGEWFPNTYYLKMMGLHDRLVSGVGSYGFRIDWLYGVWILLACGSAMLRRGRTFALAGLVAFFAQSAYGIFVGGDAFWYVRFVAPTLPFVFMGGARMVGALRPLMQPTPKGWAFVLAAILFVSTPVQSAYGRLADQAPIRTWVSASYLTAEWLNRNVKPGAVVTIYPAGTIPFFSPEMTFVDVLGKNDHHIGHLPKYESLAIGHNRFDFAYVYDTLKPDIAFVDRACVDFEAPFYMDEAHRAQLREHERHLSPAWDYDRTNPTFMSLYSRNAIHLVGPQDPFIGCFFVREGSDVAQFWSKDGQPPRARSFRYVFGGENTEQRVALAGRWNVTMATPAVMGQATSVAPGEGLLDLWIDTASDLSIEACVKGDNALEPLHVNGTYAIDTRPLAEANAECASALVQWHVPRSTLATRPSGTRLAFAALTIFWIQSQPH